MPSAEAMATADLFAVLAERSAALVDRQHSVLERLQLREEDPERLAGLYSLDHLAAQLRRNSNAALVLTGLPTIRGIHVPTLLSELAGAAVSEVNGYQRVTVGAFPTRPVQPQVASDLVHLFGDLLENALAVTPRAGGVWVRGERPNFAETNAPAFVRVGDSGTGLTDTALGHLNDMLTGQAAPLKAGPEAGLVVAREIARRHGLTIQFGRLARGGLIATVTLPDALFEPARPTSPTVAHTGHPNTSMEAQIRP